MLRLMLSPLHPMRTVLCDPLSATAAVGSMAMTAAGTIAARGAARDSAASQNAIAGQQSMLASQIYKSSFKTDAAAGTQDAAAAKQDAAAAKQDAAAESQADAAYLERQASDQMFAASMKAYGLELQSIMAKREAAKADIEIGRMQDEAAQFKARQLDAHGQEEAAAGSQRMEAVQHDKVMLESTLQAKAAASGGSASDASVQTLRTGIEQRGNQNALTELFNGEMARRGFNLQALAERMTGNAQLAAAIGRYQGTSAALDGDVATADSRMAMARAGLTVADAQLLKELAGSDMTRAQAESTRAQATSTRAQADLTRAAADNIRIESQKAQTTAYATRAGARDTSTKGTIAALQGVGSMFDKFSLMGTKTPTTPTTSTTPTPYYG